MGVKFNITQRFLGIMLLILALVSAVAFFTYKQFVQVLENAKESGKPDPIVNTTKTLITTVTKAENKVKTYTLTEDSLFLEQYEKYRTEIQEQLKELEFEMHRTAIKDVPLDTLKKLVNQKLMVYDSLLVLQNEFRVHQALEKVNATIDDVAEVVPLEVQKEEEKFHLFKRKKKKQEELTATPTEVRVNYDKVKSNLEEISSYETSREEEQLRAEYALLVQDNVSNQRMHQILEELENKALIHERQRAQETENIVRSANIQILIFCLVIFVLLILTSYTIIRYITKSTRYRKILKQAKNEAESLAQAKEHFVATVSHEIRTPMNIISGFSEQLSNTELTNQQRDQLQTVIKASSHLLKLINEVLDFTKLQNYKLQLEAYDFELQSITQEVYDLMTPLAEAKGIDLEMLVDKSVPRVIVGDSIRLSQILINVMSNAIKFTHEGIVSMHVSVASQRDGHVVLDFSVTDTGIGMSEDKLKRVFEAFEQAEVSTTRTYGGTGLGLSITKKLIELHNGTVHVTSKEGVGTEISVELPYEIGSLDNISDTESLARDHVDLSSVQILVADDEPFNRKLLVTILNKYGAQFAEVSNGREAVEISERMKFDIILMDARMPELTGVEAAQQIRSGNKNSDTPIIGLSAAVTAEDREEYFNAGMNFFLPKPFKEIALINMLLKALNQNEQSTMSQESNTSESSLDFDALKSLSGDDDTFYIEMLETFISGTQNGINDLKEALANGEMSTVSDIAHKISSPCKHLDANELYSVLKSIENTARHTPEDVDDITEFTRQAEEQSKKVIILVQEELTTYKVK